jgi:hypothetical protein
MKRLLRDVAVFLAIQAAIFAALDASHRRSHGRDHYLSAFLDKAARLEHTPSPRILVVGGSNAAFGVNSAAIERATGRPVVNLGLSAGLGLAFILAQSAEAARAGDLLILSPEYELLAHGQPFDSAVLQMQLMLAPASVRFVGARQAPQLLDTGLSVATTRIHAFRSTLGGGPVETLYTRSSYEEHGDMVGHERFSSRRGGDRHVRVPAVAAAEGAAARLAAYARRVRHAGAAVVLVPAAIPADDLKAQETAVDALWERLARETGIPVRGLRRRYPRELFFDTSYHLTLEGKRLRTRLLVQVIRRALLEARSAPPPQDRVALARSDRH